MKEETNYEIFLWLISYFKIKGKNYFQYVKIGLENQEKFDKKEVKYYKALQVNVKSKYKIPRQIDRKSPFAFCPIL